jgi:hypothetical protein
VYRLVVGRTQLPQHGLVVHFPTIHDRRLLAAR